MALFRSDEQKKKKAKRKRPRRWGRIIALLLVAVIIAGEWAMSRVVSAKLRGLVAKKLDAELTIGVLLYVPPFTVWAFDTHLTRGGQGVFGAQRIYLNLARSPLGDGPIIINRLSVAGPVLNVRPNGFAGMVRPGARAESPRKLSELLELDHLEITDGRVQVLDPQRRGKPAVWNGLSLDMETTRQEPSLYKFHFLSRAWWSADASATGTIDVDSLQLELHSLTLKARAEPEPTYPAFPAAVQEVLRKYQVNGTVTFNGGARVPLRDWERGSLQATVTLEDGSATIPGAQRDTPLDHVIATVAVQKQPGAKVEVRLNKLDCGSEGRALVVEGGKVEIDPKAGTWAVAEVEGHATFPPVIKPPPPPEVRDGPEPVLPPPKGTTALDRLAIAGRLDFTAAASGPLNLRGQNPWEAIRHEVIAYPRGASFQPKNFYRRIEQIAGGEVRLVNGTIIFQDLTGRYGDDQLNLRAARLPVAGLPKVQRWREISGTATFHPPLQRYTPKLDKILDTLNPSGPFLIAGSWTNDRTGQVVKKDYDLIISSDTGSFTLTDRQIELANIHGDATVVPAGVDLRGVTAKVLGGDVEVSGRWLNGEPYNPTSPATYEADVTLRNLDVAKLENQLVDEPPRKPLRGKIFCDGTISGATAKAWTKQQKLHSLGGDGQLEVVDGSLLQIPVLRALTQNIKGIEDTANMGDAAAFFTIADGKIRLRDAAVNSAVLGLQGGGTIGLDGTLDLDIVAAPLADWRERLAATKIPIVSDVFAEVVGGVQKLLNTATGTLLYEFRVDGPAKAARLTAVPTPVLTDTAAFVFGKMLSPPKKDQRPLDYLHRAEQGRAAQRSPPQGQAEPRADTSRDREPATR